MKKKVLLFALTLMMTSALQVQAQYSPQDSTYKKYFVGSTLFLLGNFIPNDPNPPGFIQLNLGYRVTGKDVISLELKTWKYYWPLGINPFYNSKNIISATKFPGHIREYGFAIAYQRYLWKGLYAAVHVAPLWQTFKNESGKKVGDGFHIFNTYRVGYHVKLFKDRVFIEPSLGIAGRPYYTKMPDGFKEKDDRWSKWTPEPGLHFGFNF